MEIKSELYDEYDSFDAKCETFPAVDPLALVETKLEENQIAECFDKPQRNVICNPNTVDIVESTYSKNVNKLPRIYIPCEHSMSRDRDVKCNISLSKLVLIF
ncbi:hypothetical protein L9F63_024606, partial [Diploptera punctata]